MPIRFPVERFVNDFIIGDRRLSERPDIRLSIDAEKETFEDFDLQTVVALALKLNEEDGLSIRLRSDRSISVQEYQQIQLLESLVAFCRSKNRRLSQAIGAILKEVRQSLALSQSEVAQLAGTTQIALSRWEGGSQRPGLASISTRPR